jgi:hypothetical protein
MIIKGKNFYLAICKGVFGFSFTTMKHDRKNWLWKLHLPFLVIFYYNHNYND